MAKICNPVFKSQRNVTKFFQIFSKKGTLYWYQFYAPHQRSPQASLKFLNLHFSLSVNKTNHYNSRCIIPTNIKFWTVKTAYTRTIKDVSYGWKRKLTKTAQKWPKTAKSTFKHLQKYYTKEKRKGGKKRGSNTLASDNNAKTNKWLT